MTKYICYCGDTFETKTLSNLHIKIHEHDTDGWMHQIVKKSWRGRFADWFFNLPGKKIFHFVGAYMVYLILIHHFHIHLSWWEAWAIVVGMVLYIE